MTDGKDDALQPIPPRQIELGWDLRWRAASKLGADLVGRGSQFVLVFMIQRTLGPGAYGQFAYALALGTILAPFTDLGVQLIVTREMARDSARAARIAGTGFGIKLVLTLGAVLVLAAVSRARPPGIRAATFALGVAMLLASVVDYLGYVFRGLKRVEYEAATVLVMRMTTVAAGMAALWYRMGLLGFAVAYVVGCGFGVVVAYGWLGHRYFVLKATQDLNASRELLAQALPLGAATVLSTAFTRSPVFLLDFFRGPAAVGLFGVAQKLTEPLALLPAAWMAAAFPAFSDGFAQGAPRTGLVRSRSIVALAIVGAAIAAVGVVFGPRLLTVLYGSQYAGAETALQILALALIPVFVNHALTHFLVALDWQHLNLRFNALVLIAGVVSGAVLIPRFGVSGAAGSMLIGECLLFVLCRRALGRVR